MDGYRDSTGGVPWGIVGGVGVLLGAAAFAIVLLPRLLFPHSHKEDKFVCMSNLKQLGLGMMQYVQDYDETMPPRQTRDQTGALVSWRPLIYPYVKSKTIYQCPSNPVVTRNGENDIERDGFSRSYAVNSTQSAHDFGPFADKYAKGLTLDKFSAPASTIEVVESTAAYNDFNVVFPDAFARKTDTRADTGSLFHGHQGMTNVLYCDGHVKARRPSDLESDKPVNPWTVEGKAFTPSEREKAKKVLEFSEKQSEKETK